MSHDVYYPLFADLREKPCLVVGGGRVAQRKVTTLLSYGARVTVVSPTVTTHLAAHAQQGRIRHLARRFRSGDVRGAWLVLAATEHQQINEQVYRAATRQHIFTNVVDQKPLSSFIAPAIAKRGDVVIAVSTGGGSPALAKRVRSDVARLIGDDYARMLKLLRNLRTVARRRLPTYLDRKRYFDNLVGGQVFSLVKAGKLKAARQEALIQLDRMTIKARA